MPDTALEQMAVDLGADYYGVADLAPARAAITAQGGEGLAAYPRAISVGIRLLDDIVDQLPQRADPAVVIAYRSHAYDLINQRLDAIVSRLASQIQHSGWRAYPIPASRILDTSRLIGAFSHKMAAHLAGLGWIGKSCLLITPDHGPRVRWATILTNAPLSTGIPMAEKCGGCTECTGICPVQAIKGVNFREQDDRSVRLDAARCDAYLYGSPRRPADTMTICGLCLYVCPYGRNKTSD